MKYKVGDKLKFEKTTLINFYNFYKDSRNIAFMKDEEIVYMGSPDGINHYIKVDDINQYHTYHHSGVYGDRLVFGPKAFQYIENNTIKVDSKKEEVEIKVGQKWKPSLRHPNKQVDYIKVLTVGKDFINYKRFMKREYKYKYGSCSLLTDEFLRYYDLMEEDETQSSTKNEFVGNKDNEICFNCGKLTEPLIGRMRICRECEK